LPGWLAEIVTVPVPVILSLPFTYLAGPEETESLTGRPDVAVGVIIAGVPPRVMASTGLKGGIVWEALFTVSVRLVEVGR
jgi:hypothetical protein